MNNSSSTPLFDHTIAIIGAGFGGLAMAIRLKEQGIDDFIILERAKELGGTWRDNIYPGCACDIPSQLYSFSFAKNADWTRAYPTQPEILAYLKKCAQHYHIHSHIRFETEVKQMQFEESLGGWRLQLQDQSELMAQLVVSATGPLNRPSIPDIPGLKSFKGPSFHSSEWQPDVDLQDKQVAVIGTGASAIQIVPAIAPKVQQLHLYQRTPPWIMPRSDREITRFEHFLFKKLPFVQTLYRNFIYWRLEMAVPGFKGNTFITGIAKQGAKWHIKKSVSDPQLREVLTPDYEPGCKRVLVSSNYYPALQRSNVELVTASIQEIRPTGIHSADGQERPVDVIVLATGFQASEVLTKIRIEGRNGLDLIQSWEAEGPEAYLGINVAGCPNLCFLLGPNTNLGHNSVVHMIESQVNYILDYLRILREGNFKFLDIKAAAQKEFNATLQERLRKSVWQQGGCTSWYQTSYGKNTTNWPGSTVEYRRRTRKMDIKKYDCFA